MSKSAFDILYEEAVGASKEMSLAPPTGCQYYRKDGFCKVTGGPCPHFQSTFEQCTVRADTPEGSPLALESGPKKPRVL